LTFAVAAAAKFPYNIFAVYGGAAMQKKQEAKAAIEGLEDVKAGRTVDG